jgi:hypothetical protein
VTDSAKSVILDRNLKRRRRLVLRNRRASAARFAAGRLAKKTDGLVTAETNGTPSTPEACVPRACISGLTLSASLAAAGRRTLAGTESECKNK